MMGFIMKEKKQKIKAENRALLLYAPGKLLLTLRQEIDFHRSSLMMIMTKRLNEKHLALGLSEGKIKSLDPSSVLNRGYSITRKLPGKGILKDAADITKGDRVAVTLSRGNLECLVEKIHS